MINLADVLKEMEKLEKELALLATVSAHKKGQIRYYLVQRWIPALKETLNGRS